ncbi:hypothetical protein SADUNF_Sadunf08G0041000 [Salix dunnii]|uniref:Uncharacterized protein n=1 Tax=Salix dunnii TaxID=1413687 RepID=A0A835JXA5_9ROSI|nr:hypothetical protein SADUNF_Sadunf08G0041000 [Salix dunnii]
MRKFDPWAVFFKREWNRNWPFLAGFAITGAFITKFSLSLTEEDAKNSPFVQRHKNPISHSRIVRLQRDFATTTASKPLKLLIGYEDICRQTFIAYRVLRNSIPWLCHSSLFVPILAIDVFLYFQADKARIHDENLSISLGCEAVLAIGNAGNPHMEENVP